MGGRFAHLAVTALLAVPVVAGCTVGASSVGGTGAQPVATEDAESAATAAPRKVWIDHSWLGEHVLAWPDFSDTRSACEYEAFDTAAAVELLEAVDWPDDVAEQMAVYLVPVRKYAAGLRRCATSAGADADWTDYCRTGEWGLRPDGTYASYDEWNASQEAAYRINKLLDAGSGGLVGARNSIPGPCRQ